MCINKDSLRPWENAWDPVSEKSMVQKCIENYLNGTTNNC